MKKIGLIVLLLCALVAVAFFARPQHQHEFSEKWEQNAESHWHVCVDEACGEKADLAKHTFGEGIVTTPATEEAEGVMTYTCTVCGFEKTESIEKLPPHEHSWETEWSYDENGHWHASSCGHDDTEKEAHMYDDGFIEKEATEKEEGVIVFTCVDCGHSYNNAIPVLEHKHVYSDVLSYDEFDHWYATTCGHNLKKKVEKHKLGEGVVTTAPTEDSEGVTSYYCESCDYVKEEVIAKLPHVHVFDEETLECKCGLVHTTCEICGNCSTIGCEEHRVHCQMEDEDRIIHYAPSSSLAAPEGPDGKAPGKEGAYVYDKSIEASHVILEGGIYATLVKLPNGAAAHSGVSFANNRDIAAQGQAGFNCGIPLIGGYYKHIRLYFVNTGDTDITLKYSAIDYYYDYGAVELTVKAGETKVALLKTLRDNDSTGINHQIVFTEDVAAGASLAIWGEYAADERLSSVSVSVPASKIQFVAGETFSAEGLILKANGTSHSSVYINGNFTTDLDGYVFTAEDVAAGKKTVTVNFAGLTTTYEIVVYDHIHNIEYVEKKDPTPCADGSIGIDGFESYYMCTVEGCGTYFTDATGNFKTSAPDKISCHVGNNVLPGESLSCIGCGATDIGNRSTENWVYCIPPAQIHSYKGGMTKDNVLLAYGDVNGLVGTLITFKQGTVGASGNSKGFKFHCENNLDADGDNPYQHKLPNVGNAVPNGSTRRLMVRFVNYGTEDISLTLCNDSYGSISYITVTVPAGETVFGETILRKQNGANYYDLYLHNTEALKSDVKIGVYGYMEVLDGETETPAIHRAASKTEFAVGDSFSAEGLVLTAKIPNNNANTIYVSTGYTTSLDGYTFTEADAGKTFEVVVDFAGKTCTYSITVAAAEG